MSKAKLMPCPKCQCPKVRFLFYENDWFVVCGHCHISSNGYSKESQARTSWNDRSHYTQETP